MGEQKVTLVSCNFMPCGGREVALSDRTCVSHSFVHELAFFFSLRIMQQNVLTNEKKNTFHLHLIPLSRHSSLVLPMLKNSTSNAQ